MALNFSWFRRQQPERPGLVTAIAPPPAANTSAVSPEQAMAISAVYACLTVRSETVASLPFFTYQSKGNGQRVLARDHGIYKLLHDRPNSRQTPFEFWRQLILTRDLRGVAYARIDRDAKGSAIALTPLDVDLVQPRILDSGLMVYEVQTKDIRVIIHPDNILVIRGPSLSQTMHLDKLEVMRSTMNESVGAQAAASRLFAKDGRTGGFLLYDKNLTPEQRSQIESSLQNIASGSSVAVLEAGTRFEPIGITAQEQQMIESRNHSVEDIARFFGVPPVLIGHNNVTTWGSGVSEIVRGWHMLSVRPLLVSIEQAVAGSVLTTSERQNLTVEFSHDALLRGDSKSRAEIYSSALQNGWMTRAEVRQLENLDKMSQEGIESLTVQSNLLPLDLLGKVSPKQTIPESQTSI